MKRELRHREVGAALHFVQRERRVRLGRRATLLPSGSKDLHVDTWIPINCNALHLGIIRQVE